MFKHLHGRGEDKARIFFKTPSMETPPRTWRRHPLSFCSSFAGGNTSTDVEKTCAECSRHKRLRKHLHGRGEDCLYGEGNTRSVETPPRTWRRPYEAFRRVVVLRNTSTDVEKTAARSASSCRGQKHLHGRGEDKFRRWLGCPVLETPPRTWRRQQDLALSYFSQHYHLWFYLIKGVPEPTGDH